MKLVLIQPPIEDFYETDVRLQPLGLASLKATVGQHLPWVQTKVMDFHGGGGRRTVTLPAELSYLKEYYQWVDRSPFSSFSNYFRFGARDEEIVRSVRRERPDVVGISCLFTPYYREALRVAEGVKQATSAVLIAGGCHVSAAPESVLDCPAVDYVIRGEGELPLVRLLELLGRGLEPPSRLLARIPGLGFRNQGSIRLNEIGENFALDDLPIPDLQDLTLEDYQYQRRPLTFVLTSRGCPHRCSFCSVHSTFREGYRSRAVDRVLEELRLRFRQGYRVIDFEDDNLTFHKEAMKEVCQRIISEFPAGGLQFTAMNGISYLSLDSELLHLMKEAGFVQLNLSLVSSDEAVLTSTSRPHSVARFVEVVDTAFQMGFRVTAYQILGLPYESLDGMIQTLVFLAGQPVLTGPSIFYATPDMPISRQMGWLPTPENLVRARSSAMAIETEHFERRDLFTLFITTRILNFLKGLPLGPGQECCLGEVLKGPLPGMKFSEQRHRTGAVILENLLRNGVLLAETRSGLRPIGKFKWDTFRRVWKGLAGVRTVDGGWIQVSPEFAVRNRFEPCAET